VKFLITILFISSLIAAEDCQKQIDEICQKNFANCAKKLSFECEAFLVEKNDGNPIKKKRVEKMNQICSEEINLLCPEKKFEKLEYSAKIKQRRDCIVTNMENMSAICQKTIRKLENF
jgi:hypothetical protein